jgi:hypothetical protein
MTAGSLEKSELVHTVVSPSLRKSFSQRFLASMRKSLARNNKTWMRVFGNAPAPPTTARLNRNHLAEPDDEPRGPLSLAFACLGHRCLHCGDLGTVCALWLRAGFIRA